jgi:hypothetical protein
MSAIRVPSGTASPSSPTGLVPRARDSKLSRYFLLWLPVAPFVGFTLAETVFDLGAEGDWELSKAALLGALLMAPSLSCVPGSPFRPEGLRGRLGGPCCEPRAGGVGDRHADRGVPHRVNTELAQGCSASSPSVLSVRQHRCSSNRISAQVRAVRSRWVRVPPSENRRLRKRWGVGVRHLSCVPWTVHAGHPGGMLPLTEASVRTMHDDRAKECLRADATLFPRSLGNRRS